MSDYKCWLVKSEPDCFSIQDLAKSPKQTTYWDGVRNYQARNFMRDGMKRGDRVLFYHSGAKPPAIAGTATVVREAYPDTTAQDPDNDHFDPAATPENPIWMMVDIKLDQVFENPIELDSLKGVPGLEKMELLRRGSRLSVQPVTEKEFDIVLELASQAGSQRFTPARSAAKSSATKKAAAAATNRQASLKPKAATTTASSKKRTSNATSSRRKPASGRS